MVHTPASFRAAYQTLGYTRADMVRVLAVSDRTIRRWESPTDDAEPPDGVWLWLEDARTRQLERIDAALDIVHMYIDTDTPPVYVKVPYYLNQTHYEQTRRDVPAVPEEDRYTVANATNRELAAILADEGIEVCFVYPDKQREVSQGA